MIECSSCLGLDDISESGFDIKLKVKKKLLLREL